MYDNHDITLVLTSQHVITIVTVPIENYDDRFHRVREWPYQSYELYLFSNILPYQYHQSRSNHEF